MRDVETLKPFTRFLMTIGELPSSYLISMTYEEQLLWFCNYLKNTVIPAVNNNAEAVIELQNLYSQLKDYVDNYFENLDVQEEINNKLDEMVEDGTFETIFNALFPVLENEIGVTNSLYNYGDIKRYGGKCDGITDDKDALNTAITNALLFNFPVRIHNLVYVSETINTKGVEIIGDKQPTNSGAIYPNNIGYDYPKNVNQGESITFSDYINTVPNGTAIISDSANPILSTDYDKAFNLNNFGLYGWLRNTTQEGVAIESAPANTNYYPGGHKFKNFSVFNVGLNGIHLHSLEGSNVDNLRIELCNGYGLYIEGYTDYDTPFDYNKFENCIFRYTRLNGIYLYKTYRQNNEFNHCEFDQIGQYNFGHVNDIYGDRTQPENNSDIIYGIYINYLNTNFATQARSLRLINNFGEQINGLIKIENIDTISGLTMLDNSIVRNRNSVNSCYCYLSTYYLYGLELNTMNNNVETIYDLNNLIQIRSDNFLPDQFVDSLSDLSLLFKSTNKTGYKAYDKMYGNYINCKNYTIPANNYSYFNASTSSEQSVTIDVKELINSYFPSNWSTVHGQPFTLALLTISAGGNTTDPAVCDLIAITRHNNKCFVSFLTNNTNATADTTGIISITVPPYKVATLQFIQQVDTLINQL